MGFQQGLSGLNATSKNLEIIGNNIANANTYGAKAARGEFSDIYAAALSGTGTQPIGIGTKLAAVAQQFTQGSIATTSNPMDLAINGSGFFQVADTEGVTSYTRNGQFKVDRDGYVVNNAAQRLLGYSADGEGQIQVGIAGAIRLPTGGIEPKPTQNVVLEMNLNAGEGSTNPVSVAIELSQKTADDAEEQGISAALAMDDALAAMVAVTSTTPEAAAALTALNAARTSTTTAAAATTASAYGAAPQATAETNAATSQTAAEAAVTAATAALAAVQSALAVEPSNGDLIKTETLLEDALNELNSLVSDARRHTAAVDAVPTAEAGPSIDFAQRETYNSVTSLSTFDAKGQEVALTYYFQKTGIDNWSIYATANGTTVAGSNTAPQPIGTLTFSADGASLLSPLDPISFNIPASVNQAGAPTMAITGITLDLSAASQFGSPFGVTDMTQDGFAAGQLTSITVEKDGVISARYSNGLTRPAGQIEIANFRNPQGLQPIGDNAWVDTFASGEAVVGVPGDGNLGSLLAGALEESNVDITGELVSMITAQRIYQANAQTIKTIDQVMQTIVNLR